MEKVGQRMTVFLLITLSCGILGLFGVPFAQADATLQEVQRDVESLKAGQIGMQNDIQEIKNLLRSKLAPPAIPQTVTVSLDDDPYQGKPDAPLTLVEFSDYQCPFCARHFRETLPQIAAEYIKTGKLRYVFRDFPLDFHAQAERAAQAAQCAGDQGKYWQMHDQLFTDPRAISLDDFTVQATTIALDLDRFNTCLSEKKYAEEVKKDLKEGQQLGITGTPGFFIGRTDTIANQVKGARPLIGAQPYASFKAAFDALLAPPPAPSTPAPPQAPTLAPTPLPPGAHPAP